MWRCLCLHILVITCVLLSLYGDASYAFSRKEELVLNNDGLAHAERHRRSADSLHKCSAKDNDHLYPIGLVASKNPCYLCRCDGDYEWVKCFKKECPNLPCPNGEDNKIIGCCPVCRPGPLDEPRKSSHRCESRDIGQLYPLGTVPSGHPCYKCNCAEGDVYVHCTKITCSKPRCRTPIHRPNTCCSVCKHAFTLSERGRSPKSGKNLSGRRMSKKKLNCSRTKCPRVRCILGSYLPRGRCCYVCRRIPILSSLIKFTTG